MLLFTLHTYLEELLGSYGDLLESLSWSTRTDQTGKYQIVISQAELRVLRVLEYRYRGRELK